MVFDTDNPSTCDEKHSKTTEARTLRCDKLLFQLTLSVDLSLLRSRDSFHWTRNKEKEGKRGRQRSVFDLCVNYITRPNIGAPLLSSRRVNLFDFATCSCARNSLSYCNVWLVSSRTMPANPENGSKQMFLLGFGRWNELRRFTIFRRSWECHARQ